MRPLRYSINVTLDGCCDHRAIPADEELHRHAMENIVQADALLFGRVTYEMMEAAWRLATRTVVMPEWTEPFARTIDAAKKYVVSSTLDRVDWNAKLVRGELGKAVQQLKQEPGKGLLRSGSERTSRKKAGPAKANETEAERQRPKMQRAKEMKAKQREELLSALKARFEKNLNRHQGLEWAKVQAKLEANTEKLWSLNEMERTGGDPDVVGFDKKTGEYIFYDCSAESPKGRRSVCYDREGQESRKEHKPENNALDMAATLGIELLTEEQYRELQQLGNFDMKTSSWVKTPAAIRKLGGALFCDRRYDNVFVYHNGAESYYAARGFRGSLRV